MVDVAGAAASAAADCFYNYRAVAAGQSLDQSGQDESVGVISVAASTINLLLSPVLALTAGNFAKDDRVQFELFRDTVDVLDTLTDTALLHGLIFKYSDSA